MEIFNSGKTVNSMHLRKLKKPAALSISILFIISIFASCTVLAAPFAVTTVFSSGFEDNFNSWTSTYGGVSVVSSPVYSGSYAMKCSDPWGSQATKSIGTLSETYTEAQFYFDKNFAGSQTLIAYFNGAGSPSVLMGITAQSGKIFVFVHDILPSYSYSQYQLTAINPGTWYKFALDASASSATIYMNDQKLASVSQTNIPATSTVKVGMFWGDGAYTGNLYIDSVQVGSTSGGSSTPTPTPTPSSGPSTGTVYSADQCLTQSVGTQSETYTEAQFSFDKTFAGSQTLIAYFNGAGSASVSMGISTQSGRTFVFVEDKLPSYSYSQYQLSGVNLGVWNKFALDASATSATIYMNDQKLTNVIQTNIPATSTVKVGMFWGDGAYTGNLYVNNVKIGSSYGGSSIPAPTPVPTVNPTSTPAPTPVPTTAPTPNPNVIPTYSGNSLPMSALGDDYLTWSNWNGDPNYWASQIHWFTDFHCNTARLAFSFADDTGTDKDSTYSYAKLNTVLSYLNSVGVKAVLVNFAGFGSQFYGSTAWANDWKNLAASFAGDSRIKALELANEPYIYYLAPNANTMNTFNRACASLIDQIRSVDPSRTIMMPIEVGVITNSVSAFYNDLVSNGITSKGNIMYDITHPYYFESCPDYDPVNNPLGAAEWCWNAYVLPQISLFGVQNCWAGETFPWSDPSSGGTHTYAIQQQFEIAIINHCVSIGLGFQMWGFFSRTDQQVEIDALNHSNYYALIHGYPY